MIGWTTTQRLNWRIELEDRLAALDDPTPETEDPALAIEVALLRKAGRRSAYDSEPSRLFRGNLRRAFRQLWLIELARMHGDYRDRVTDRLFTSQAVHRDVQRPRHRVPAASVVRLADAISAFEKSEIEADEAITDKTKKKKKAALIERYFGPDYGVETLTGGRKAGGFPV